MWGSDCSSPKRSMSVGFTRNMDSKCEALVLHSSFLERCSLGNCTPEAFLDMGGCQLTKDLKRDHNFLTATHMV